MDYGPPPQGLDDDEPEVSGQAPVAASDSGVTWNTLFKIGFGVALGVAGAVAAKELIETVRGRPHHGDDE